MEARSVHCGVVSSQKQDYMGARLPVIRQRARRPGRLSAIDCILESEERGTGSGSAERGQERGTGSEAFVFGS